TVIAAADGFALDPAGVQHAEPMRALVCDDARLAAVAAVQREALAQDLDRDDHAGLELLGDEDGLPILAQVAPGQGARTRVHEILLIGAAALGALSGAAAALAIGFEGRRHVPPPSTCSCALRTAPMPPPQPPPVTVCPP